MASRNGSHQVLGELLKGLLTLEYDIQAAFEAAIVRLDGQSYKEQLREFLADQQRHIMDLKRAATPWCHTLPHGPDAKQVVLKGVLMLAHLAGDRAVLLALREPLRTLNTSYEQAMTHSDVTPEILGILQRHFMDERRQRNWLGRCLNPEMSDAIQLEMGGNVVSDELTGPHPINFQDPNATDHLRPGAHSP